jgi:hypothetical protein
LHEKAKQWQKTRKLIGRRIKSIFSVTSSLFAEISIRSRNFQFSLFSFIVYFLSIGKSFEALGNRLTLKIQTRVKTALNNRKDFVLITVFRAAEYCTQLTITIRSLRLVFAKQTQSSQSKARHFHIFSAQKAAADCETDFD